MTFLGWIFIPLGVGICIFRPSWLLPLAIIAAVFQAGSVLNISGEGLPPYYFVSTLIILRWLVAFILRGTFNFKIRSAYLFPLLCFWVWASVSALVMPLVFQGLPIESIELPEVPLHFSFANTVQVAWLTLNVGMVLFAAQFGEWKQVRKAFAVATGIATTVMLVQLGLVHFGYQFPDWLFQSNPGQHQAILGDYDRPNGLFSEPSFAGVLFTALTAGALARFLAGASVWLFIGSLACTLLVRSASSLAAFAVCCVLLLITYFPVRKFRYVPSGVRRYAVVAFLCLAVIAIVIEVPSISEALAANTLNKGETDSFIHRTASDLAGLTTFRDTYGLGAGIGSMRTSSFLVTLLATAGVGTVLFIWFTIRLLRCTKNSALRWMFVGGLLAQVAGVSDLHLPLLWMNVCIMTVFSEKVGLSKLGPTATNNCPEIKPKIPVQDR